MAAIQQQKFGEIDMTNELNKFSAFERFFALAIASAIVASVIVPVLSLASQIIA